MDDSSDSELEDKDDLLSEDELFFPVNAYERFVKDDDVCSDFLSDSENIESDNESIPEQRETEADDILYSGQSKAARVLCCCYRLCLNTSLHVKHSAIYLQ